MIFILIQKVLIGFNVIFYSHVQMLYKGTQKEYETDCLTVSTHLHIP